MYENKLPISRSGYDCYAVKNSSTICLVDNLFCGGRKQNYSQVLKVVGQGHLASFDCSFHMSNKDLQKKCRSVHANASWVSRHEDYINNPVAVINSHHLNVCATDTFSEIHPDVIAKMGPPLDLPLHASLSHNGVQDITGHFKSLHSRMGMWIDTRGTIAHVGAKHRELVANSGSRWAFTTPNIFRQMKKNTKVNWSFKKVSGKHAAKPGNYFLYRQPIRMWDHDSSTYIMKYWIGIATCATLQTVCHRAFNFTKLKNILSGETRLGKQGSNLSPLDKYFAQPHSFKWTQDQWTIAKETEPEEYFSELDHVVASAFNVSESKQQTPLAILVKRLESQLQEKKKEADDIAREIKSNNQNIKINDYEVAILQKRLIETRAQLNASSKLRDDALSRNLELAPKASISALIASKIEAATALKKLKLQEEQEEYRRILKENQEAGRLPDYAAGLASSGIVITDLVYKSTLTGNKKCVSNFPDVSIDPNWKLITMHMETNKPIPIIFGLREIGEQPRVSGPHKIVCGLNNMDEVYTRIGALTPFSAVGLQDGEFKSYPHMGWVELPDENYGDFVRTITRMTNVCMGELGPNIAKSFRENSPKAIALAMLSFLQSVNPTDPWGESYEYFPFASDVVTEEAADEAVGVRASKKCGWYWIQKETQSYMDFDINKATASYGNYKIVNGEIVETTRTVQENVAFSIMRTPPACPYGLSWVHSPCVYRKHEHCGSSSWWWADGPPRSLVVPEPVPTVIAEDVAVDTIGPSNGYTPAGSVQFTERMTETAEIEHERLIRSTSTLYAAATENNEY